jgi:DNA-binding NarL/FixJ family response regulator
LSFCGEAENITKALAGIAESMPHVVLIDLSLKSENGLELVKRLRSHDESIQLLVWSMHPEGVYAERVLRAGANGYIEKSNAASELVEAINTVLGGKVYLSETMSSKLLLRATGKCTEQTPQSAIETLTDRELEMFGLLGNGMTTQQIAATMHVSQKTVDTYRARIKEKLGLANSSELVFSAIRWVAESSQTKKPPVADI